MRNNENDQPENSVTPYSDSISTHNTELSIVMLCYRSEKNILPLFQELIKLLANMGIEYEIVLVANDFAESKDITREIVLELARTNQRVIAVTKIKEGMMGWDMLEGIKATSGKYICVIDGDGQFPIDSISLAYEIMITKNPDIVKTYRIRREDGAYRFLLSLFYNLLFKLLYPGSNVRDVNSKPKMISRFAYERMDLKSTDWFIDAEIMILAKKLNLSFHEIPIVFSANQHRRSFVKTSAILEFMNNLVRYKFKKI